MQEQRYKNMNSHIDNTALKVKSFPVVHHFIETLAQLKIALRKNGKNLAADVRYLRSLSNEKLFNAKIVTTGNGHNRFKKPAYYSKCKLLFG